MSGVPFIILKEELDMKILAGDFAKKAVELAMLHPPIAYVLGGRTRQGTDCSNLIRLIIKELGGQDIQAGSNTLWNTHVRDQAFCHEGGTLKFGGLLPGDLLFIDYNNPVTQNANGTPGKMDHVGIYIGETTGLLTPDGQPATVVHASLSRGMVCGSTLKNAWTHRARLKVLAIDFSPSNDGNPQPEQVNNSLLAPRLPTQTAPESGQAKIVTNDKKGLNLRKQPEVRKDNGIKTMPDSAIVDVLRVWGEWAEVRYVHWDGVKHVGWCRAEFLLFG
jgi:hypothetical protein